MPDWTAFALATAALTLSLLFLTRRSERLLERARIADSRGEVGDAPRDVGDARSDLGAAADGNAADTECSGRARYASLGCCCTFLWN